MISRSAAKALSKHQGNGEAGNLKLTEQDRVVRRQGMCAGQIGQAAGLCLIFLAEG